MKNAIVSLTVRFLSALLLHETWRTWQGEWLRECLICGVRGCKDEKAHWVPQCPGTPRSRTLKKIRTESRKQMREEAGGWTDRLTDQDGACTFIGPWPIGDAPFYFVRNMV